MSPGQDSGKESKGTGSFHNVSFCWTYQECQVLQTS